MYVYGRVQYSRYSRYSWYSGSGCFHASSWFRYGVLVHLPRVTKATLSERGREYRGAWPGLETMRSAIMRLSNDRSGHEEWESWESWEANDARCECGRECGCECLVESGCHAKCHATTQFRWAPGRETTHANHANHANHGQAVTNSHRT